jgi:hypothetical protein
MKFLKIMLGLFALLAVSAFAMAALFERIEPAEIGVKQYMWGSGGYVEEDHFAGFHWGVTGIHKWHILDRRTHFLTFSDPKVQSGFSRRYANAQEVMPLEIRTKDDQRISVDLTVTYRVIEGEAHLLVAAGRKADYKNRVAAIVRGTLREALGKLDPEQFVDTTVRNETVAATLPILEKELAGYHVRPESILIRAFRFLETYEEKLQDKQLAQQLTELAKSKSKVEGALMATGKIEKETEALEKEARAEWDKKLQDAKSTNEVEVAVILAAAKIYDNQVRPKADATYETMVADGKLLIDQAEALRDELRNAALDSVGGRILQARDAAENLIFDSVTLNSNDPAVPSVIDIDKLVDLLVGEEE